MRARSCSAPAAARVRCSASGGSARAPPSRGQTASHPLAREQQRPLVERLDDLDLGRLHAVPQDDVAGLQRELAAALADESRRPCRRTGTRARPRGGGLVPRRHHGAPRWPRNGEAAQSTSIRSPIARRVTAPWKSCRGPVRRAARRTPDASRPGSRDHERRRVAGVAALRLANARRWLNSSGAAPLQTGALALEPSRTVPAPGVVTQSYPSCRALQRSAASATNASSAAGSASESRLATRSGGLAAQDPLDRRLELLAGQRARDRRARRRSRRARGAARARCAAPVAIRARSRVVDRRSPAPATTNSSSSPAAALGVLEVHDERVDDLRAAPRPRRRTRRSRVARRRGSASRPSGR